MNWLTNYIKPKLESLVKKKDVPRNLWIKCACEKQTMIYYKDFEKSLGVCKECGTHMRLPSDTRIKFLLDDRKYEKIEVPPSKIDPLSFKDKKQESLLGNVHEYCDWGNSFDNIHKVNHLPIIKVWNSR